MSWASRGGARYYYRDVTLPGGRRTKVYCGRGALGEAAAAEDARRRRRREDDRRAAERLKAELAGDDALADAFDGGVELLAAAALLAEGFHRANYGPWRRRHDRH
jgi:hypothetical protein